ncbi:MAG: hypothetical protein QM642_09420 [Edaphocola sp.]
MRFNSIKNVLDKKYKILPLRGLWSEVLGEPEASGIWLIYGLEKMGKTTISLLLADELSEAKRTGYIMAEQGFDKDFQDVLNRLSIPFKKRNLRFAEYIPISELSDLLKKKNQPDILFMDNLTIYADELRNGGLRKLIKDHPNKLFIMLAHEEKGEPYTATAKLAKKLAKRILHVEGNTATVEGRGPGGTIVIDEDRAQLYHGTIKD